MKLKLILPLVAIAALTFACSKPSHTPVCDGSTPTYDADISLIINDNCLQCHGTGSSNGVYTTYAGLEADLNDGDFEKEVLTKQKMPKNGSLTESQLNLIQCWVENGYPEN